MIQMEDLKPIVEELLDGREDAADYIEKITALDKAVDVIERTELDKLNESWNERFKKAFFGEKVEQLEDKVEEIKEEKVEEIKEEKVEEVAEDYDGEDLKYEDLFKEVEEKED